MTKAAARIGDMHACPMVNPGGAPHTGGPISPSGSATVFIGGQPAAKLGDSAVCAGPPDSIVSGSASVMINAQSAARMGDSTAHGGTIASGFPSVMIGG